MVDSPVESSYVLNTVGSPVESSPVSVYSEVQSSPVGSRFVNIVMMGL